MRVFRAGLAIVVLLGAAACGRKAATIDISPKRVRIYGIGNGQSMTARLLDKKGRPIEKGTVTWSSSKPAVASVDGSGRATARGGGKAMVIASFEKISSQVPIEVVDVKTLDMVPPSLRLIGPPGMQFPLEVVARNSKGTPIAIPLVWTSLKASVVTVDSRGEVTAVGPGTAAVMARVGDLQSACDISVAFHDLERLELRPDTAILHVGEVQKFEAIGFGADGKRIEGLSTIFQSSDRTVASVDALGVATGISAGTATIRASLGAVSADATLLVN